MVTTHYSISSSVLSLLCALLKCQSQVQLTKFISGSRVATFSLEALLEVKRDFPGKKWMILE